MSLSTSVLVSQWMIVFGVSIVIAFAQYDLVINAAITNAAFLYPRTRTQTSTCKVTKTAAICNHHYHHHREHVAFMAPYKTGCSKSTKSTSSSSSTSKSKSTSSSALSVSGIGWDNEDFLESLGKGPDEIKKANDDYNRLSKFGGGRRERLGLDGDGNDNDKEEEDIGAASVPDAALSLDQVERIKRQNEADAASGGEMFRKLLERAEQQKYKAPPSIPQQQPVPTVPSGPALPDNFASLSVEQQAALFRELMFNQQQGTPPLPIMQTPSIATGTGTDSLVGDPKTGRRVGRNRDADAIVNTSDVYLAQLKIDSTSRNRARYSGDEEFANQVFADPRIQQIKLHVNPYLEEQKKNERELFGGDSAEYLLEFATRPIGYEPPKPIDVSTAGIKYKDRLNQRRQKKQNNQSGTGTTSATSSTTSTPPTPTETSASTVTPLTTPPPMSDISPAPVSEEPAVIPDVSPPPIVTQQQQPEVVSVPIPPPPPVVTSTPVVTQPKSEPVSIPSPAFVSTTSVPTTPQPQVSVQEPIAQNEDDFRRQLRTLEGLLLKHRGGPGFGLGRLQGQEIQRLIATAESVLEKLRSEEPIIGNSNTNNEPVTVPMGQIPTLNAATPPAFTSPQPASSMITRSFTGTVPLNAADASARLDSMTKCVEGSIQMFKFSPPGLRESVLITVRAALLSALTTCNECMNDNNSMVNIPQASSLSTGTSSADDELDRMMGYLDGAIQMYKFSPPELQSSILISFRAALLSAVNTCNSIIADNEIINYAATATSPRPVSPSTTTPQFTEAEYITTPPTPMYRGDDENTQYLETVYNQLRAAQGTTGKMGLRDNLTSTEAQELADSIAAMRSILVDELDTGIPEGDSTVSTTSTTTGGSTKNLYQQMLAKARASNKQE